LLLWTKTAAQFSKPWKIPRAFFQALGIVLVLVLEFPIPGKTTGFGFQCLENFLNVESRKAGKEFHGGGGTAE
jgi:hypothetical protein